MPEQNDISKIPPGGTGPARDEPIFTAADMEALVGRERETFRRWEEQKLIKLRRDSRGNLIATTDDIRRLRQIAASRDERHGRTGRRRTVIATSTYIG
jgi:hypothetical protein